MELCSVTGQKIAISGNHVKMEFKYDPDEIYTYNPPIHGSVMPGWGEAKDYLAELIYQGKSVLYMVQDLGLKKEMLGQH